MKDFQKHVCLLEELKASKELILSGFGELQEINFSNDAYHLPHQLLASGFERLMKCYICLVYEARHNNYPGTQFLRNLSHDLTKIKQTIINEYFLTNNIPLLKSDYDYIKNDEILDRIVGVLSKFGKYARYYNLDIVTGSNNSLINPTEEWEKIEKDLEDPIPYMNSTEAMIRDYYPKVNSKIIAKLEHFARAISMQFTLDKHGPRLQQCSSYLDDFKKLDDSDFGQIDYRRSVKILQKNKDTWKKRNKRQVLHSCYPSKLIRKADFDGDWPFRFDEVVIECRNKLFCIINIEGYDFALNGSARSRYQYPYPHEAGIAIIGKSVGPFIDMAFDLSENE